MVLVVSPTRFVYQTLFRGNVAPKSKGEEKGDNMIKDWVRCKKCTRSKINV